MSYNSIGEEYERVNTVNIESEIFSPEILDQKETIWNGRWVKLLRDSHNHSHSKIISCSKRKNNSGHAEVASGFTWIAGGVALLFLPFPGARAIGVSMIIGGARQASKPIMEKELENKDSSSSFIGVSTEVDF